MTDGTTTPEISISQASSNSSGYLSEDDWNEFNSKLGSSLPSGHIYVGDYLGKAQAVAPGGDVSANSSGDFSVIGLRGRVLSPTAPTNGQVLKYDGGTSQWAPENVSIGDLKTSYGTPQFPNTSCGSNQTLNWTSLTDTFFCDHIQIDVNQVADMSSVGRSLAAAPDAAAARDTISAMAHVTPGAAGHVLQSDGTNWVSAAFDVPDFDASKITSGTIHLARLPSTVVLNGGNSGSMMIGPKDSSVLHFQTFNSPRVTVDAAGNVGIGTTTPSVKLHVMGTVKVGNDATACHATNAGAIRWTGSNFEGCDGTSWVKLSGGGGALRAVQVVGQ